MNPPILAVIQAIFPQAERGKAFGFYGAVAGLATALGPLAGGLLIAWNLNGWDWRPVFLVNLPIGVAGLAAAARIVPESRGNPDSFDLPGIALVSAAMVLITYPLIEGQDARWPPWTFACLASALPVLALFAWWEARVARRGKAPLVTMSLFASRSFAAGTAVSLVYFAGFIGLLFVLSLYLQTGLGWSALHAGLAILPFAAGTFAGAACSDPLAGRIGRGVLQIGSVTVALATLAVILVIHAEGTGVTAVALLPALLIGGLGSGMVIAPNIEIVLSGVSWQDAGSASGVLNASQRLGQAIGIAVVGVALLASLGPAAAHTAPHGAAGQEALAGAWTHATQVASLYALGALVLTALLVPFLPRLGARPCPSPGGRRRTPPPSADRQGQEQSDLPEGQPNEAASASAPDHLRPLPCRPSPGSRRTAPAGIGNPRRRSRGRARPDLGGPADRRILRAPGEPSSL